MKLCVLCGKHPAAGGPLNDPACAACGYDIWADFEDEQRERADNPLVKPEGWQP